MKTEEGEEEMTTQAQHEPIHEEEESAAAVEVVEEDDNDKGSSSSSADEQDNDENNHSDDNDDGVMTTEPSPIVTIDKVDRTKTCPFLIRLFWKCHRYHVINRDIVPYWTANTTTVKDTLSSSMVSECELPLSCCWLDTTLQEIVEMIQMFVKLQILGLDEEEGEKAEKKRKKLPVKLVESSSSSGGSSSSVGGEEGEGNNGSGVVMMFRRISVNEEDGKVCGYEMGKVRIGNHTTDTKDDRHQTLGSKGFQPGDLLEVAFVFSNTITNSTTGTTNNPVVSSSTTAPPPGAAAFGRDIHSRLDMRKRSRERGGKEADDCGRDRDRFATTTGTDRGRRRNSRCGRRF